jgi:hypothetical protein
MARPRIEPGLHQSPTPNIQRPNPDSHKAAAYGEIKMVFVRQRNALRVRSSWAALAAFGDGRKPFGVFLAAIVFLLALEMHVQLVNGFGRSGGVLI